MSSDYYFNKWKKTLVNIEKLIELDLEYQHTKIHDQLCCDATRRLTGILGRYILCYNDALDCLQYNLQVQKTVYIAKVVKALVFRIVELKEQLRKLEGAYHQFLSNGMIEHKLTPYETEITDIPTKCERSDEINQAVTKAFENAKEKEEVDVEKEETIASENIKLDNWWEDTVEIDKKDPNKLDMTKLYEVEEKISEETLNRRRKLSLIQAHEKTRQVTQMSIKQKQRREIWKKELKGILNPPERIELRERAAKLIQVLFRFYFKIKRNKLIECKRDELLQLRLCSYHSYEDTHSELKKKIEQTKLYKKFEEEREDYDYEFKKKYFYKRHENIAEDIRDNIRDWFQQWYKEARFFYDIPNENLGGSTLILKEEVPTPAEWKDMYEAYLEDKKANKNKNAEQLKWERKAAKEEELMLKKEEIRKRKLEANLLKKMMKNPTLHPGYSYPKSKKIEHLSQTINNYYEDWYELDKEEALTAKEKFVKDIDEGNLCMEVKLEINKIADIDMREELKLLKKALKEDYDANDEQMPEPMKQKPRRKKKHRIMKTTKLNEEKLTNLAKSGVLTEYPRKDFRDFLGDSNYVGDDIRCKHGPALNFGGETRAVWWERCLEVIHGFKRILLVGPEGGGKTTLVHIMATVNDAVLYKLDPTQVAEENQTPTNLQQLISSVASCARATQPSVIHIKGIHKLFYNKVPPEEMNINFDLIKRYFIRKLFKRIHHRDNITVIGTCVDPWLAKSKQMLKIFPAVLLLPDTNYSVVNLILRNWVLRNRVVPFDLDIHSLAHVLQGYSFGYIIKALDNFLTADRIINIAAYGLTPQAIYNYILEDENETKVDYKKYLKWYTEKTRWGKIESKRLQEDLEFQTLVAEWKEKIKKKRINK